MIVLLISLCALIGLAVDLFIYLCWVRKATTSTAWRVAYCSQALLINLTALIMTIIISKAGPSEMYLIQWVVILFMISFAPKLAFSVFLLLSMLVRSTILRYIGSVVALSIALTMIIGVIYGRRFVRVEHVTVASEKVDPAFDGYTIAQITDLHLGNLGLNSPIIRDMVDSLNTLRPDLVLCTGDIVNLSHTELDSTYIRLLSKIEAPVLFVLGNHDLGVYNQGKSQEWIAGDTRELISKLRGMGWRVLVNEQIAIHRGSDSIIIAGVGYPKTGFSEASTYAGSDLAGATGQIGDSTFALLMTHTPVLFDSLEQYAGGITLAVAGHTHAMQAKIKIGDWQYSPASNLYSHYSGLYRDNGRYLYVNDGIGYVLYPMRIGARPEITLFTLKNCI